MVVVRAAGAVVNMIAALFGLPQPLFSLLEEKVFFFFMADDAQRAKTLAEVRFLLSRDTGVEPFLQFVLDVLLEMVVLVVVTTHLC